MEQLQQKLVWVDVSVLSLAKQLLHPVGHPAKSIVAETKQEYTI